MSPDEGDEVFDHNIKEKWIGQPPWLADMLPHWLTKDDDTIIWNLNNKGRVLKFTNTVPTTR